jgi:hypothetical protein
MGRAIEYNPDEPLMSLLNNPMIPKKGAGEERKHTGEAGVNQGRFWVLQKRSWVVRNNIKEREVVHQCS